MSNQYDIAKIPHSGPDNKPAASGTSVTIDIGNGPVLGTMIADMLFPTSNNPQFGEVALDNRNRRLGTR